jgi:hypothetical protein
MKKQNTQNLHSFFSIAFLGVFVLSRHQQIWNQHKILRFFASAILQKGKSYFLPISIILGLIPIKFETLKPPGGHQAVRQDSKN